MRKLEFRGKEIIVAPPKVKPDSLGFNFEEQIILEAKILYTGKNCNKGYKEGDVILYEPGPIAEEISLLGIRYVRMPEEYVICIVLD